MVYLDLAASVNFGGASGGCAYYENPTILGLHIKLWASVLGLPDSCGIPCLELPEVLNSGMKGF